MLDRFFWQTQRHLQGPEAIYRYKYILCFLLVLSIHCVFVLGRIYAEMGLQLIIPRAKCHLMNYTPFYLTGYFTFGLS